MADVYHILFVIVLHGLCRGQTVESDSNNAEYTDCGGHILAGQGYFDSPGFPDWYPNNVDCFWTIITGLDDRINIVSKYFIIEDQSECSWDYVEITDNGDDTPNSWRFCGSDLFIYNSTTNSIVIHFHTDSAVTDVGFRLEYNVIKIGERIPDYCNSTITTDGYITSPNYPMVYPKNTYCLYNIQAPPGYKIHLEFLSFHVETEPCHFDKVGVYDVLPTGRSHIATLCGKGDQPVIISRDSSLILTLYTDSTQQFTGFNASLIFVADITSTQTIKTSSTSSRTTITPTEKSTTISERSTNSTTSMASTVDSTTIMSTEQTQASLYNSDCSSTLTNNTGYITSPDYPASYSNNKNCRTILQVEEISSFVIQFLSFDVEGSHDCAYDKVILSADFTENSTSVTDTDEVVLCSRNLQKKIYSFQAKSVQILFKSDKSVNGEGYSANYYITPISSGNACHLLCENGATCMKNFTADNIPVWSCICPPSYHGELCEKVKTTCLTHTCHNGGKCLETGDDVTCHCGLGFMGKQCETKVANTFSFLKKPQNTSVARGSSVLLECDVSDHTVAIMWLHRDRILSIDDHSKGINIYPGGVLMIPDIHEEHEGQYTCTARSAGDWIESSAWLSLVGPCHLRVVKVPKNLTRDDGDTALFECFVPGAKSIIWHKDGDIIFPDSRKTILVNNYLMIQNLVETDAGIYTCAATGDNGCFSKKSATLRIKSTGHNEYCGRPIVSASTDKKYRIASGREAEEGSAPWHVIIWETVHDMAYCGGSLVSENWVLTAAHCVSQFEEYFEYKFDKTMIEMFIGTRHCHGRKGVVRKVKDYVLYPSFNGTDFNNDLALFQLDKPVRFNQMIMPICLEGEVFTRELLKSGKAGIVTGCGNRYERGRPPAILHEVTIPYVPRELCRDRANAVNASFTEFMICAGYARSMRGDACAGDSGGPYSMKFNGRWVLVGIVSWGVGCDRENQYGYYTHIAKYYDWILSITSDKQRL